MAGKKIPNYQKLKGEAKEIATTLVNKVEARHMLIWWLSSYEKKLKKGRNNETVELTPFQTAEFRFSYKISENISNFFLIIQEENWFINNLGFSSATIDEYGLVLKIKAINEPLFSLYINEMSLRINFSENHKDKLIHAQKYAKQVVLVKSSSQKNMLLNTGEIITISNEELKHNEVKRHGAI